MPALVLSTAVAAFRVTEVCSSESLSPSTDGAEDAFASSLGSGFLASLILKPGGGPPSEPCVDVSVA